MPTKSSSIIHRVCFEWAGVNRQSRCQVRSSVCVCLFHVGKQESWTQSDASKNETFSVLRAYVRTSSIEKKGPLSQMHILLVYTNKKLRPVHIIYLLLYQ